MEIIVKGDTQELAELLTATHLGNQINDIAEQLTDDWNKINHLHVGIHAGNLVKCNWQKSGETFKDRVFRVTDLYSDGTASLEEINSEVPLWLANIPLEWLTRVHKEGFLETLCVLHGDEEWHLSAEHCPNPTPPRQIRPELKPGDVVVFASEKCRKKYGTKRFLVTHVIGDFAGITDYITKSRDLIVDTKDLELVEGIGNLIVKE